MGTLSTLHELAYQYAEKESEVIDAITEETPILQIVKWKATNKGLENVVPVLTDIKGAAFVEMDSPLPFVTASRDLRTYHVMKWGATDEVTSDAALRLGGANKYFADNFTPILRKSSAFLETTLFEKFWLRCAQETNKLKKPTLIDAGSTDPGAVLLAVHFDDKYNTGIYDPLQFAAGSFFKITYPYNGAEHILHGPKNDGIFGFAIKYECLIGYQLIEEMADRCCAAIVNIDDDHMPTDVMVDDILEQVRAQPGSTYLFCTPKVVSHGLKKYKKDRVQMTSTETDIKTTIQSWDGIPIVTSYNLPKVLDKNIQVIA